MKKPPVCSDEIASYKEEVYYEKKLNGRKLGSQVHLSLKLMSNYAMIQPMKYSEIETYLAPFRKLAETVPGSQIQGTKVAGIMLLKLEEQARD